MGTPHSVNQGTTSAGGVCPQCGKDVDPLRAGAVSIADGRIIHYCSSACREAHLNRGAVLSNDNLEDSRSASVFVNHKKGKERKSKNASVTENSAFVVDRPDGSKNTFNPWMLFKFVRPILVEIICLVCFLVGTIVLPVSSLNGYMHPVVATGGVLFSLIMGFLRERRRGVLRLLEIGALPLASFGLIVVGVLGYPQKTAIVFALALLIMERLGRLIELIGRRRSKIFDVIAGMGASLPASEWRDNSTITAWLRRLTIVLEWLRIPLAIAASVGLWLWAGVDVSAAIIAGATVLVALNPRVLRMTTGDAYLATALKLAQDSIVIRDAHAINKLGISRVALFMTRRVLVAPTVKVLDWKIVGESDESRVISALWALESVAKGRFAEAIRHFISDKFGAGSESIEAQVVSGVGLKGDTAFGRVLCGTRTLLLEDLISTAEHEEWANNVQESGRRAFFVALNGCLEAVFTVEEEPLDGVLEMTRGLSLLGMDSSMITSAEVETALSLGGRLGIDNVRFGLSESALNKVLSDMTSSGDTVLLVGNGAAFEESVRTATSSICLRSDDDSQAGVNARMSEPDSMVKIVAAARGTLQSVRINVTAAFITMVLGAGLAGSWHYASTVAVVGALGNLSCAFSTFNGPYPLLRKALRRLKRYVSIVQRILGIKRTQITKR